MSTPTPPPPPTPPGPPAAQRGAQVALGVFLAVLVALLLFRGYGARLGARPAEPLAVAEAIDLNTADQSELAQVPGVGPKMAEAIVDHRRLRGSFRSVDDLRGVRGVGPVTFDKLRHQFRVGNPPPVEPTSAPQSPEPSPAPAPAPRPTATGSKKVQPGEPPVNVNTATAEELQRLPGVGPVTANAILTARTTAPFQSTDDLRRVKGIGPKTLDKLRPYVVVK
jgi:competence protein ComEA